MRQLIYRLIYGESGQAHGAFNFWTIFGVAILVVAYLAYPDPFHHFFQYLQDMIFDSLHESFGTDGDGHGNGGANGGENRPDHGGEAHGGEAQPNGKGASKR